MIDNPIRRGQLIAPFGVGAMVIDKRGTAMVTAALDYWYRRERGGDPSPEALEEFRVHEWRLERRLGVSHFRLPPDWREAKPGQGHDVPNAYLSVPFLKFPTWYSCRKCGQMAQSKPTDRQVPECLGCKARGWKGRMVQVPIVAVCRAGHLMEFPWREWVHRRLNPSCEAPLRLVSRGGATLSAKWVECTSPQCKVRRHLGGVTTTYPSGETAVTNTLTEDESLFLCSGERAWVGNELEPEACGMPIQGSLRSALNVYYADVQSAIFLPVGSGSVPDELIAAIEDKVKDHLDTLDGLGLDQATVESRIVDKLVKGMPTLEQKYGRDVLVKAARQILQPGGEGGGAEEQFEDETIFRHEEALALQSQRSGKDLLTRVQPLEDYGRLAPYLAGVTLAEKIKETRVLNGFTRVDPPSGEELGDRQRLLWLQSPAPEQNWLPAQVVYGEGIYLALYEEKLQEWERRPSVEARVGRLMERAVGSRTAVSARMMLLHTLSHLLMNQLTFSCGYSSATLRERLYASSEERTRMAGLLIYTAEGDSDGTLGGLVRMGKGVTFTGMFEQAIMNASWCSADPVCMEAGDHGGQGPGSMNLAACHSCALVPETACEAFNRYLDRALVVGTPEHPELGFFANLLPR